jgi:hypothetical protein
MPWGRVLFSTPLVRNPTFVGLTGTRALNFLLVGAVLVSIARVLSRKWVS